MKRSEFIKSIAILCAAPKILTTLPQKVSGVNIKVTPLRSKKVVYFTITQEMQDDPGFWKHQWDYQDSLLRRKCREVGINLNEPFDMNVGWNKDDFIKNRLTCVISQYTDAK